MCNFANDCNDNSDEALCPSEYDFESGLQGWINDPADKLEWKDISGINFWSIFSNQIFNLWLNNIITVGDEITNAHGPHVSSGKFAFLVGESGASGDYTYQVCS